VAARLSNFCCRTHFVRRDVRVERSSDVTSCFQKWRKCLLKKCANGPFYDTKSPDYRDQYIRANAWEGIGKELKIKRKFFVSSRDVRIVCPRLKKFHLPHGTSQGIRRTEEECVQRVHVLSKYGSCFNAYPYLHIPFWGYKLQKKKIRTKKNLTKKITIQTQ